MSDHTAARALKARLDRTWSAFFARFGNFRPAQLAAIPALLDGNNLALCAPTASGKTEAALAPLVERHCPPLMRGISPHELRLVYLTPTRALVNDLHKRLQPSFESLRLPLAVKTRDLDTFNPRHPSTVLITTPESLDSLLCSAPRLFISVRAIVIDELHLFDGTPRGDQLRVLLNRIRQIRAYAVRTGDAPDSTIQYVALSATLSDPATAAARYFPDPVVIAVPGERNLEATHIELAGDEVSGSPAALSDLFDTFRARGWCKALAFCNSRAEVEYYATVARERSPFGNAVFVHYSNLTGARRREIEEAFAAAEAAICFASSTLELGVDIGDVDVVLLIGVPGVPASFAQRIGRGGRRKASTPVVCLSRTPMERLMFEALCAHPEAYAHAPKPFQMGVSVQQIFSLLKQSPSGSVRRTELLSLFAGLFTPDDLDQLIGHLTTLHYLKVGRPGEWRADIRLDKLVDQQNSAHAPLSLHSNIRGASGLVEVRNQHTHQLVATVDATWLAREVVTLEGRAVRVEWADGDVIWVNAAPDEVPQIPHYVSARQLVSFEMGNLLAAHLGFALGDAPLIEGPEGFRLYHWLGDLFGGVLFDLLRPRLRLRSTEHFGLYFLVDEPVMALPTLDRTEIVEYLARHSRQAEAMMSLSPFHHLLPARLRRRVVIEQFGVDRLMGAYQKLRMKPAEALRDEAQSALYQL